MIGQMPSRGFLQVKMQEGANLRTACGSCGAGEYRAMTRAFVQMDNPDAASSNAF